MKSLLFLISILLINTFNLFPQWYPQNSGTTNDFSTSFFLNQNLGWAAGADGTIHKTTDGGINWISHSLITSDNVHTIFFIDSLHGWLTMYEWVPDRHGSIYYSTDGGEHWTQQLAVNGYALLSVHFATPEIGWVVGTNGFACKTTNRGLTWNISFLPTDEWLFFVFFINEQTGWISGGMDWIYKTTNGGNSWFSQPIPVQDRILSIFFLDDQLGWVCGTGGRILRTTNGGSNWIYVPSPVVEELRRVKFVNRSIGWIVGLDGKILHSIDGGEGWSMQNSGTSNSLYSVNFVNEIIGWAVGANGTILTTENGGIPVELVSFKGEVINNFVTLSWITASEKNNYGFEIERKDKIDWEMIGFVEGHGTSTELQHYFFNDEVVQNGNYNYRLKQIDFDGSYEYSIVIEIKLLLPSDFELDQNYPNPFNPGTKISFRLTADSKVNLKVFDMLGQEVATLINTVLDAGSHHVDFDASDLNSGVYFYKLDAVGIDGTNFSAVMKMILLK